MTHESYTPKRNMHDGPNGYQPITNAEMWDVAIETARPGTAVGLIVADLQAVLEERKQVLADLSSAESEIQWLKVERGDIPYCEGHDAADLVDDDLHVTLHLDGSRTYTATPCIVCTLESLRTINASIARERNKLRAEIAQLSKRPDGWEYTHEHQGKLVQRDGMMCEQHPGLPFEHDPACPGPGMPWMVEGRTAIEALRAEADALREERSRFETALAKHLGVQYGHNLFSAIEALRADLDFMRRLHKQRGDALQRPCIHCGYQPKVIVAKDGA